jgi:hypothetical protein
MSAQGFIAAPSLAKLLSGATHRDLRPSLERSLLEPLTPLRRRVDRTGGYKTSIYISLGLICPWLWSGNLAGLSRVDGGDAGMAKKKGRSSDRAVVPAPKEAVKDVPEEEEAEEQVEDLPQDLQGEAASMDEGAESDDFGDELDDDDDDDDDDEEEDEMEEDGDEGHGAPEEAEDEGETPTRKRRWVTDIGCLHRVTMS